MRRLALPLVLLAVVALAVLAPQTSAAADFPAFADAGAILSPTDAGFHICGTVSAAAQQGGGWNGVLRCTPFGVYYCATQSSCTPTQHNQYLPPDVTFDIGFPGGFSTVCIKTFDGGVPSCTVNYKRDRGE